MTETKAIIKPNMQLIRPLHISSYFQCPRKAYLLFNSVEQNELTDYEVLVLKSKEKASETYFKKIEAQCYKENILEKGASAICNAKINLEHFDFDCQLLLKRETKSSLGKFYYEPAVFIGTNKISKEHRMELAFLGVLLEKIQSKFPDKGLIIDKNGNEHALRLKKLITEIKTAIDEIQNFKEEAPKLILNSHCAQCSFQPLCKVQAIKDDNLTLLNRITPKQISKLEKKGIFTIKQLSYIYKPRRKNKRVKNHVFTYKPELQALSLRTEKTYIQKLPTLERKPLELFLDMEYLPDDNFFYLFGIVISETNNKVYHSFWSDTIKEEESSWKRLIDLLESYPESSIYH